MSRQVITPRGPCDPHCEVAPERGKGLAGNREAKEEGALIVTVGPLYVRGYPARFKGDYTLTTQRSRCATFHVEDVAEAVAASLTAALGAKARTLQAKSEKEGGR